MRGKWLVVMAATIVFAAACSSSPKPKARANSVAPQFTYSASVTRETVVDNLFRQGIALGLDDNWVFSVNDGLFRTDAHFTIVQRLQPAIPTEWTSRGFNHIGDIDVENGIVYAPIEQPNYKLGRQAVLEYDAATLKYRTGRFIPQNENSFVTVDASRGIAYSMMNFGGDELTRYDVAHRWKPMSPVKMSRFIDKVQGGDARGGAIYLSTDDVIDGVYRVGIDAGDVTALGSIGHVDGEGEGIDVNGALGETLHVLSVDVKLTPVRVIEMKVKATPN